MKTKTQKIIFFSILVMMLSLSTVTYALNDYTVLAPLPGIGDATGKTDLTTYIPAAFKFGIGLAAVMAFVMITFGGIMYATSDAITGKSQGREYIEHALWGLILVIGAYVLLYTINPKILSFDLTLQKPNIAKGVPTATTTSPGGVGTPPTAEQIAADAAVRARLAGINVNHPNPCGSGQTRGCTSLDGLHESAIQGLLTLKSSSGCGCAITITGGTEDGHLSHGVGIATVDLSKGSGLDAFVAKNKTGTELTRFGPVYTVHLSSGRIVKFLDESGSEPGSTGNHWHVVF
ncbi:MAG TPA: hypothetical protein VJC13_00235 [Candidatus Paceibacterota bacterium]|nr:hypothetical protein [uncultured archaeon]